MASTTPKLTDADIAARIKSGRKFCEKFTRNDRQASIKFRDGSTLPFYALTDTDEEVSDDLQDGGDVPQDTAVGASNLLTTNMLTKVASIAIGSPDWHVKTGDMAQSSAPPTQNPAMGQMQNAAPKVGNAEIVRQFMRDKWRLSNWVRLTWKALLKRYVGGMGIIAYRWDSEKRSQFEHVQMWDFAADPHTTDWSSLRWAARKIKMPLSDAIDRYGAEHLPKAVSDSADRKAVVIWLYYDKDEEIHVHDDAVLVRSKNLYGKVPILIIEGDIDPGPCVFPISDAVLASGLQAELSDVNLTISNRAKHGGPINLINVEELGKGGQEALEDGREQGYIAIKDSVTPPVIRIPGEELSQTLLAVKQEMETSIDGITGVTQYDRGVVTRDPKFATEAALESRQSGARGTQARIEFERFLNRMAEIVIALEIAFGGPKMHPKTGELLSPDEEMILWEALQDVQEINVVEDSTTYKDPNSARQESMTLLQLMAQLFPLFAQAGFAEVPNLIEYTNDVLRAFGRNDTTRYWQPAPPPPPMMPPGSPAGPGAAPAPAGPMQ